MSDKKALEQALQTVYRNKEGKKVKVFTTEDKWYGMTYKEDTEMVKIAINDMVEKGLYK